MKRVVVEGMMCGHCVNAIKNLLIDIEGVHCVEVSLEKGEILVKGSCPSEEIKRSIEGEGYKVVSVEDIEECQPAESEKKGIFSRFLKKLGESNKKNFGDKKIDCCSIKKD